MIKICKECGKEFEATNGRQQYCSREHYRPCPKCGTPVLIKYLSDPTPRCKSCRYTKSEAVEVTAAPTVHAEDVSVNYSADVRRYAGVPIGGWIPDHLYAINIDRYDALYHVTSYEDVSDKIAVDLYLPVSSMIQLNKYFQEV